MVWSSYTLYKSSRLQVSVASACVQWCSELSITGTAWMLSCSSCCIHHYVMISLRGFVPPIHRPGPFKSRLKQSTVSASPGKLRSLVTLFFLYCTLLLFIFAIFMFIFYLFTLKNNFFRSCWKKKVFVSVGEVISWMVITIKIKQHTCILLGVSGFCWATWVGVLLHFSCCEREGGTKR